MYKFLLFSFALFVSGSLFSQKQVFVNFIHLFENQSTNVNDTLTSQTGNYPFYITDYNYYISRVEIIHDGGQVLKLDSNQVFLVKMNRPEIDLGILTIAQVEQINFKVGVPEYLNHLDISLYNQDEALSFQTPPMHWGWNSGYMHHIVSAMVDADNNGSFEAYFQLHNLGDLNTEDVTISTIATEYSDRLVINVNTKVDRWLRNLNISTIGIEHGSTGFNSQIMQNIVDFDVFSSPATASISEESTQNNFSWTNQEGENKLLWKNISPDKIEVFNIEGKLVSVTNNLNSEEYILKQEKGMYLIRVFSKGKVVFTSSRAI